MMMMMRMKIDFFLTIFIERVFQIVVVVVFRMQIFFVCESWFNELEISKFVWSWWNRWNNWSHTNNQNRKNFLMLLENEEKTKQEYLIHIFWICNRHDDSEKLNELYKSSNIIIHGCGFDHMFSNIRWWLEPFNI